MEQISARNRKGVDEELRKIYSKALRDIKAQIKEDIENYEQLSFSKRMETDRLIEVAKQVQNKFNDAMQQADWEIHKHKAKQLEAGYYGEWYVMENTHGIRLDLPVLNDSYIEELVYNKVDGERLSQRLYRNTTKVADRATQELLQGMIRGASYQIIAAAISEQTEASYKHALRIAWTEGHQNQNAAKQKEYEEAVKKGVKMEKKWMSTLDKRTRHTHQIMDGQTVEIDEKFTLPSGDLTIAPGLSGIPSEDIQCRCTTVQEVDGRSIEKRRSKEDGIIDYKSYREWAKEKGYPDPVEVMKQKLPKTLDKNLRKQTKDIAKDTLQTIEELRQGIPTLRNLKTRTEEFISSLKTDERFTLKQREKLKNKLAELLAPENAALRMRVPADAEILKNITNTHFKNQFETNTSKGALATDDRTLASQKLFGTDPTTAKGKDFEKYGYLFEKDLAEEINRPRSQNMYGNVIIEFKDTLRERTTFTLNDSLGIAIDGKVTGTDLLNPDIATKNNGMDYLFKNLDKVNNLDDLRQATNSIYVEAQYHGQVTMDDVGTIVLDGESFKKGLYDKLIPTWKEKGINVKANVWEPGDYERRIIDI